jgi:hypothetical protein
VAGQSPGVFALVAGLLRGVDGWQTAATVAAPSCCTPGRRPGAVRSTGSVSFPVRELGPEVANVRQRGYAVPDRLADMSEVSRRASGMANAAVGATVGSAVSALCVIAGTALGEPVAFGVASVPAGAAANWLSEDMAGYVASLYQQRRQRLHRFAGESESVSGTPLEDLLREARSDPRVLEMLARCVEAASRSLDDEKIDLLARIYVSGARDSARVDEAIILVEALRPLEAPHLRLLTVLAKPGPHLVPGRPTEERPRTPENMARVATWRVEDILRVDPGLSGVFDALVARLNSLGLVYDEGSGRLGYEPLWFLTQLGWTCVQYLGGRGSGPVGS